MLGYNNVEVSEVASRRYELTDEQWDKIKHHFEVAKKNGRPYRYGEWNAVYKCFSKWQEQGLFEKIFEELALECDLQDLSIDSTSVKVHKDASSKKKN